jgi:murein DD-endopeptidase MepM/ murein hydrolase activator NlpD
LNIKIWIRTLILVALFVPLNLVHAQEPQPSGPVYIVQSGDTLWGISQTFRVTLDDLTQTNGIIDPSQLSVGAQLIIPGLEGLQGTLETSIVPFGESFYSLSRRFQIPFDKFARLNRYTHSQEVYAGSTLIIPVADEAELVLVGGRAMLLAGQSLLELAITQNVNPWSLLNENDLVGSSHTIPGDVLHLSGSSDSGPGALPASVTLTVDPFPIIQGETVVIKLNSSVNETLQSYFVDSKIDFFAVNDEMVTIQGVPAMYEPGFYPFAVSGTLENETPFSFSQKIYLKDGGYPYDPPLAVTSETVDVENTQPEDLEWFSIVESVTPEKMWEGPFLAPVPEYLKDCFPSEFGHRRSYNGSAYLYYHTGLDFCGNTGVEISAPAPGIVVFSGPLTVRGNATVIDHGWGVYSAYAHQSEIYVSAGDRVETGQLIGLVGATGRVTGPHLHWEVIVAGTQVNPMDWLERTYP